MQVKTYLAIENVLIDGYINRKFFINYLNIGKPSEIRLDNIGLGSIKLLNPDTNSYGFESCLRHCISYYENEVEILKKYHPNAIILPYTDRIDKLKKQLKDDMDVPNGRFNWDL